MRAGGRSLSSHPASSLGLQTSEVAAAQSNIEDKVEFIIDDDMTGKELAIYDLGLQSYLRQEVCLSILDGEEVKQSFCIVPQIQDNKMMQFSRTDQYE